MEKFEILWKSYILAIYTRVKYKIYRENYFSPYKNLKTTNNFLPLFVYTYILKLQKFESYNLQITNRLKNLVFKVWSVLLYIIV